MHRLPVIHEALLTLFKPAFLKTFLVLNACLMLFELPAHAQQRLDEILASTPSFHVNAGIACTVQQGWQNGAWQNNVRYLTENELTTVEVWRTDEWSPLVRFRAVRDGNGNVVLLTSERWLETAWINLNRDTHVFNTEGVITYALRESWENEQWVKRSRDERHISADADQFVQERWQDNMWVFTQRSTAHKTVIEDTGFRLTESTTVQEEWRDNTWVVLEEKQERLTEWIDGDNVVHWIRQSDQDGVWVNEESFLPAYNDDGSLRLEQRTIWENGDWILSAENSYIYDADGDLTEVVRKRLRNGQLENESRSLYGCATATSRDEVPQLSFRLNAAYPNPFINTTTLSYALDAPQPVTLKVYDALGREVATLVDGTQSAGEHRVQFDGSDLSSGMYLYQLQAGGQTVSKPLVLMQ